MSVNDQHNYLGVIKYVLSHLGFFFNYANHPRLSMGQVLINKGRLSEAKKTYFIQNSIFTYDI
jgi:hypothetical protein